MGLNTEESVAATALVVAGLAFIVAIGQILSQYLNTADGYRRCQREVIGAWASETRRRFRWRQFRFEVTYVTPRFGMVAESEVWPAEPMPSTPGTPPRTKPGSARYATSFFLIAESEQSRLATFTPRREASAAPKWAAYQHASYLASWCSLLDRLHQLQGVYSMSLQQRDGSLFKGVDIPSPGPISHTIAQPTIPCLVPCQQSWDFMPPELLRPVASIALGDLIVFSHRLGLTWQELKLGTGSLHAEGHGQAMIASMVRGFGLTLQYTRDESYEKTHTHMERQNLLIPSAAADKLGFGIIQGTFGIQDLHLQSDDDTFAEIHVVLNVLMVTWAAQ